MNVLDAMKEHRLFCDGGMGSLLQAAGLAAGELPERWNLSHPEVITNVHRKYLAAGADIMTTNTFGANRHTAAFGRGGSRFRNRLIPPPPVSERLLAAAPHTRGSTAPHC